MLYIENVPEQAPAPSARGIPTDSRNPAVYRGADQSLSLLERPTREPVEALGRYPELSSMPVELVFELA